MIRNSNVRRVTRSSSNFVVNDQSSHIAVIDSESSDEDVWEVETILAKQVKRDGSVEYLLKWRNHEGEPTWEPEGNLGCDKLIKEFEFQVEMGQRRRLSTASYASSETSNESVVSNRSDSKNNHTKSVTRRETAVRHSFTTRRYTTRRAL